MEVSTIIEMLRQSYLDNNWDMVLESIEVLQREELEDEYADVKPDEEF